MIFLTLLLIVTIIIAKLIAKGTMIINGLLLRVTLPILVEIQIQIQMQMQSQDGLRLTKRLDKLLAMIIMEM